MYLTTEQVAERLNVPTGTLRYWRLKGTGPRSLKVGPRQVRYRADDVDAYLEAAYEAAVG